MRSLAALEQEAKVRALAAQYEDERIQRQHESLLKLATQMPMLNRSRARKLLGLWGQPYLPGFDP